MSSSNESTSGISVNTSAEYNSAPLTVSDGGDVQLQTDVNGKLLVVEKNSAALLAAIADLKTYTDGIEALLTAQGNNTDGLESLITTLNGYTDGIEGLLGTLNTSLGTIDGRVDGLEALIGTTNSALATIEGYLDGLEGYTDDIETLIGTTNSSLTTIAGYVDGLETLITATNAALTTLNTNTPAVGQATMAASSPVVIASNQTAVPVSLAPANAPWLSVVDQIDTSPGPVLDTASTNIKSNVGTFTVAVASLAAACKKIRVADTTGEFIGVYVGGAGAEVLAFIINPGQSNEIEHSIAAAARVTLRSMGATDITSGLLCMQFLG